MLKPDKEEKYLKVLKLKKEQDIPYAMGCRRMGVGQAAFSLWLAKNREKLNVKKRNGAKNGNIGDFG